MQASALSVNQRLPASLHRIKAATSGHGRLISRLGLGAARNPQVSRAQPYGGAQGGPQGGGMYPPIYQQPPAEGKLDERQEDMLRVGTALRNIGWLSFWGQLVLTVVSTTILLFSTGVPSGGGVSFTFVDIATLFGIVCGYISTFLAWSYTRAGRKLGMLQDVKLPSISGTVIANSNLNLLGLGATIISLQAIVGGLVAKTLSSASSGAYYAAQRVAAAPPVAFDVFSVQACTNTIMAHFVGLLFSNWILMVVNKYNKRQADRDAAFAAETAPSAPPMPGYY